MHATRRMDALMHLHLPSQEQRLTLRECINMSGNRIYQRHEARVTSRREKERKKERERGGGREREETRKWGKEDRERAIIRSRSIRLTDEKRLRRCRYRAISLRAMIRENLLGESHLEEARPARHINNDMPATTTPTTTRSVKKEWGSEERPRLVWASASQSGPLVRARVPSSLRDY